MPTALPTLWLLVAFVLAPITGDPSGKVGAFDVRMIGHFSTSAACESALSQWSKGHTVMQFRCRPPLAQFNGIKPTSMTSQQSQ